MSKVFLQKLRMVASEADDLLTSCDASDLLDGLEVARDFMFEAASMIEELESRLAQVERERDAALRDMTKSCVFCKHSYLNNPGIDYCQFVECCQDYTHFDWRGVCAANTEESDPNAHS